MSRLAPALARRIDRLARHAHAFHRFAHHPLCDSYRAELVFLGSRTRVCRGCAAALAGTVLGISIGIALRPSLFVSFLSAVTAGALAAVSLRVRLPKLAARLLPALLGAMATAAAVARAVQGERGALLATFGFAVLAATVIEAYRQRGPSRAKCASCPERLRVRACSGLAPIVRRERAFQRLAQRWLDRASNR